MTGPLVVGDVQRYLQTLASPWQYPADTVDTLKAGHPESTVSGIAVAWLPFSWALQRANTLGCSLFVTHEPTFYDHADAREELFALDIPAARRVWLQEKQMAVLRCHDLWDRYPQEGITDAWAEFLGLEDLIDGSEFSKLFAVPPTTARSYAADLARRTAPLGQPGVQLIGDGDRRVETVCIGTGAISPYLDLVSRFQPDLVVCSDDGLDYWRDGAFAVDGGPPIVVVHHGVTEEPGIAKLASVLRSAFPEVAVHHIEQRCMYEFVTAEAAGLAGEGNLIDGDAVDNTTKRGNS